MKNTKRRSPSQLAMQRKVIAEMYLKGALQSDIADRLGLDQSTISRDIATMLFQWRADSREDIDRKIAAELARINLLEQTYWAGWERSCQAREIGTSKVVQRGEDDDAGKRMEAQTRTELQAGDPRFLQGVAWCISARIKLFGMDEPAKVELTGGYSEPIKIVEVIRPSPPVTTEES